MQKIIFILLIFISTRSKAQTISPDSAKFHIGEIITVCGKISGTHISQSSTTFLNFGNPFPNHSLTAVILAKDTANFKEYNPASILENKLVCVTGKVKLYKEKPEIILESIAQLKLVK